MLSEIILTAFISSTTIMVGLFIGFFLLKVQGE